MTPKQTESEGVFHRCGCHYTIDDDGIHFCEFHANAKKTISSLQSRLEEAEKVIEAAKDQIQRCESWSEYPSYFNKLEEALETYEKGKKE